MGDIVLFVWRLLPVWLFDRLDGLFRLPFWKALAVTALAPLSVLLFFASPGGFRQKVKLAAVAAALAFLAVELARPLGFTLPWG